MAQDGAPSERQGLIKRLWTLFWTPNARWPLGVIVVGAGLAGAIAWGAFNWTLEISNTEAFCISCHEMRDNPYKELQQTIHFKNRSGVRATCPDCHVPHPYIYKLQRKVKASNELFHKLMGTVDTPEKFEAKRLEMARNVWKEMGSTDSRECRNCHQEHSMDFSKQTPKAAKEMKEGFAKGMTCIDCHKGIAHKLPKDPLDDDDDDKSGDKAAPADGKADAGGDKAAPAKAEAPASAPKN